MHKKFIVLVLFVGAMPIYSIQICKEKFQVTKKNIQPIISSAHTHRAPTRSGF